MWIETVLWGVAANVLFFLSMYALKKIGWAPAKRAWDKVVRSCERMSHGLSSRMSAVRAKLTARSRKTLAAEVNSLRKDVASLRKQLSEQKEFGDHTRWLLLEYRALEYRRLVRKISGIKLDASSNLTIIVQWAREGNIGDWYSLTQHHERIKGRTVWLPDDALRQRISALNKDAEISLGVVIHPGLRPQLVDFEIVSGKQHLTSAMFLAPEPDWATSENTINGFLESIIAGFRIKTKLAPLLASKGQLAPDESTTWTS